MKLQPYRDFGASKEELAFQGTFYAA